MKIIHSTIDWMQVLFTAYPSLHAMVLDKLESGTIEQHKTKDINGNPATFHTDQRFWECECEDNYIHAAVKDPMDKCLLCGCFADEMPDARVDEIAIGGRFSTDDDWLVAYNITGYYAPLDAFDTRYTRLKQEQEHRKHFKEMLEEK